MRPWRIASALAAVSALCVPPAADAAAPPSDADITKSFETRVAELDKLDPRAPLALETHLRYADYLAKTPGENCSARLKSAQWQWQSARQNVAIDVVLPQGLARAADIEYQIHTALASCGDSSQASSHRDPELRAALEAAQRAATLYEDTFDYPAMVTMQFNAALTYQNLGDTAAAKEALKSVIEADREYGFREDAEENYRVLLSWADAGTDPGGSPSSERVAALMQDFPKRSTTLNFAWVARDDSISLKSESARVIGDAVVHAGGDRTVARRIRRRPNGWIVTYQSLASHYSLEPLPPGTGTGRSFVTSLADMLLQFHDFTLNDARSSPRGAYFNEAINRDSANSRVQQEARAYQEANPPLGNVVPEGTGTVALAPLFNTALQDLLSPAAISVETALDYNLETGAWPGATLEQGQWYGMELLLPLPFSRRYYMLHQVQFAFTREVPCGNAADGACVEILLRAIPDDTELKFALRTLQRPLHLRAGQNLHSSWTMYMRLITDPATLQTYHRDMHQHFYVSFDGAGNRAILGADRSRIDASPVNPPRTE